jgi:hypothetical protein
MIHDFELFFYTFPYIFNSLTVKKMILFFILKISLI